MANEELAQSLDRLKQQLSHGPQLDEATLHSLRVLLDDIQRVCANPEPAAPDEVEVEERSLNQRLQDVIEDFELRHPQLTSTLSQIADRLSDMGI
jgi:hypothetical protein